MNIKRLIKHLVAPHWIVSRVFPQTALATIEAAISASEKTHDGELRFAVEAGLHPLPLWRGQTPRQRAEEVFAALRVWDTEHNSGVLIYVQLVDRRIEIVADRGISAKVAQTEWDASCRRMEEAFRAGRFEQGTLTAVTEITALLARHFPPGGANPNELPDRPVVL
ncbi:MAG: TPM domain-containing protein [Proteobacteria bacterium]|nr:TPM domain-containing protein [Pseudomonadota bacterium]